MGEAVNGDLIWAVVTVICALALWDMVRRWSFATATRTLKAELGVLHDELDGLRAELGDAKLPERVKRLETGFVALKTHAESQRNARANPFLRKAGG